MQPSPRRRSAQRPEVQAWTFFRDGLPSALVVLGRQVQDAPTGRPDFPAGSAQPVPPEQIPPVAHSAQRVHSQPVRRGGQLPLHRSTAPMPAVPPIRSNGFVGSVFSWHTHLSPVFDRRLNPPVPGACSCSLLIPMPCTLFQER